MAIRAVLFDFDGTLADSFTAITASVNHVRQLGRLPSLSEREVRLSVGLGLDALMAELVPTKPVVEAVRLYREHHEVTMRAATRLFPEVLTTLEALHSRGYKLGVCSNKAVTFTKELVEALHLSQYMGCVVGPEDADGKPKPDPTMLLAACERLGVRPDESIYIGDMSVDVLAGKNAGIPVWLVHLGEAGRDDARVAGPQGVLAHFRDILDLVA